MGENLLHPEKWVPYLSVMQRLAQLNPTAVALALSQNGKKRKKKQTSRNHAAMRRWCCHLLSTSTTLDLKEKHFLFQKIILKHLVKKKNYFYIYITFVTIGQIRETAKRDGGTLERSFE